MTKHADASEIVNKTLALADVVPHKQNYNAHPPEQIATLRESIRTFGQVQPVVVQAPKRKGDKYTSIAGHGVCEAMRQEGRTRVKADIIPAAWSYAKALAYLAAANETAKRSDPDQAQLARIVSDVAKAEGEALAKLAAGDAKALRALMAQASFDSAQDADPTELVDRAAELQKKWRVSRGDLFEIPSKSVQGKAHRILCGDSTSAEDVARLDVKAAIGFSDPPYGIDVDTSWLSTLHVQRGKPKNASDDKLQGDDGLLDVSCAFNFNKWFVWGFPYIKNDKAAGWLVWDKNPGVDGGTLGSPVEMAQTNLWKGFRLVRVMWGGYYRAKGEKREPHPTQKPLGVIAPFVEQYTGSGNIIADMFLGSGTTLVACEQTGRIGRGLEIEPRYVSVCLERLSLLGLEPRRVTRNDWNTKPAKWRESREIRAEG